MSRYLYKKIQNISPESLNFQHSGLKLTTLRYYLGMRVSEIAAAEDVDPSRVRDSIRRGLKQLAKYF